MNDENKDYLLHFARKRLKHFSNDLASLAELVKVKNKQLSEPLSEADVFHIMQLAVNMGEIKAPAKLKIVSAKELSESSLPKLDYCVDQILSHGVTILSAKSKMYKSWLAMQLCLCVCRGLPFLDFKTHRSDCLYVDLENDLRLTKERLSLMLAGDEAPENFMIVNEVPTMERGFIATMEDFISNHPDVKLIVVDIFARIKYPKKSNQSDYDADYKSISELKEFASKHDLTILLIAHNRKMVDISDPFSNILGSTALMGACDESIVIYKEKRSDKESTISITGRTVQSYDFKAEFDTDCFQWHLLGSIEDFEARKIERKYNDNPVVNTIKNLVIESENGSWCGRLNDLIECSRKYGNLICDSPQSIGRGMTRLIAQLSEYDDIAVKIISNGSGSKKYKFTKVSKE